jgi:hypothetical protein
MPNKPDVSLILTQVAAKPTRSTLSTVLAQAIALLAFVTLQEIA